MVITALPPDTVHLLGSAQALTTPTSLVKELIDNSIDAHATSIDIIISPNTLDKIEVRDNGHGIAEDDLDALGRRGHTSKLRTFDDLKSIGGISLGFRGEALASAVQLGNVSVTTRTDGEPVASLVKLKAGGGVASQTRISHPVGTTVSVTNFMFRIPVRKHKFETEAIKTLGKVKELLQGYALARPHIRFGLKVTKGGKGSWSFAPRPNDGIKEAVSQILSRSLAAQCVEQSLPFVEHPGSLKLSALESSGGQREVSSLKDRFTVEAYLPRSDADQSKIGYGQWISIDSRPVAHDKGTMRKIVTMFKYYIKHNVSENADKIKNPFLRLNLICPKSSYDPNVEPAKDDVLFGNESLVLDAVEGLFKSLYGVKIASSSESTPLSDVDETQNSFNLLLARKPSRIIVDSPQATLLRESESASVQNEIACEVTPVSSTIDTYANKEKTTVQDEELENLAHDKRKGNWSFDVPNDYNIEHEVLSIPRTRIGGWPAGAANLSKGISPLLIDKSDVTVGDNQNEPTRSLGKACGPGQAFLLTPQNVASPVVRIADSHPRHDQGSQPCKPFQINTLWRSDGFSSHDSLPQDKRAGLQQLSPIENDDDELFVGDDSETYRRRTDFISARHAPAPEVHLQMVKVAPSKQKPKGLHKPFMSPLKNANSPLSIDSLRQTTLTGNYSSSLSNLSRNMLQQGSNEELAWAMDYENRKDIITRRRRDELRAKRSEPAELVVGDIPQSSPYKNRYRAAIASLEGTISSNENVAPSKEPFRTTLPDGDARAYLMRRQRSILAETRRLGGPVKLTRAKSMRLPLETVPDQEQLQNVLLGLPSALPILHRLTATLVKCDTYVSRGTQNSGLRMSALETTLVATRIEKTVGQWMKDGAGNENEVLFSFENLLSGNSS